MSRVCKDATRVLVLVASAMACTGCTTPGPRAADRQEQSARIQAPPQPPGDLPRPSPLPAGPKVLSEQERLANLAAVRAFLDRTSGYDLSDKGSFVQASDGAGMAGGSDPVRVAERDVGTAPAVVSGNAVPGDQTTGAKSAGAVANTQVELLRPEPVRPSLALPVVRQVSIRTAPAAKANGANETPQQTSNAPLNLHAKQRTPTLEEMVAELADRAKDTSDFDTQWRLSLIQLALGQDTRAAKLSENLSPGARRIMAAFVRLGTSVRGAARNPFLLDDSALERTNDLRKVLADLADPVVSTIALCRKVGAFGVYEEMVPEVFIAGRTIQTIIYCEIRNFASDRTDEGRYRTLLGSRVELLTADGESVWEIDEPQIEDICHQRRTDFFLAQRVSLPPTLPAGEYVLKVFVEDKLSGKAGESSIPLTINAPATLAGRS